ncbi:MAG: hypothetical protein JSW51_11810 [Gemmatimonadota bacterium]|nr:MAG: hypothetical protein JSW51_11810 [Gemmatimonadota bacterium]
MPNQERSKMGRQTVSRTSIEAGVSLNETKQNFHLALKRFFTELGNWSMAEDAHEFIDMIEEFNGQTNMWMEQALQRHLESHGDDMSQEEIATVTALVSDSKR